MRRAPSSTRAPIAGAIRAWRGRPWREAVIYELHVGTFTAEGTFGAAAARLPALAELGITTIELMPVADFPGRRNWGYDGVLPFAPDASYGTPDELKALVDSAHALGLMVLIDVVYNHFGPDGNYLHAYCPEFFNPAHPTPWGAAINFDGDRSRTVRDFFVHNALYWVEEFHADGLRLDAIHAIRDDSAETIVREICSALRDGPGRARHVHVVVENDANRAALIGRNRVGAPLAGDRAVERRLPSRGACAADRRARRLLRRLRSRAARQARAARSPRASPTRDRRQAYRDGAARGEPSAALPPVAFVSSLQTHDQVGNRAFGERIARLADRTLLDAAYACLLLAPHVPMLFMGEEFEAVDAVLLLLRLRGELAAAVTQGPARRVRPLLCVRRSADARERIPDPNAGTTFYASKLAGANATWSRTRGEGHRSASCSRCAGSISSPPVGDDARRRVQRRGRAAARALDPRRRLALAPLGQLRTAAIDVDAAPPGA
jgi:maltooligosyltrehalose trehalohydrolase